MPMEVTVAPESRTWLVSVTYAGDRSTERTYEAVGLDGVAARRWALARYAHETGIRADSVALVARVEPVGQARPDEGPRGQAGTGPRPGRCSWTRVRARSTASCL